MRRLAIAILLLAVGCDSKVEQSDAGPPLEPQRIVDDIEPLNDSRLEKLRKLTMVPEYVVPREWQAGEVSGEPDEPPAIEHLEPVETPVRVAGCAREPVPKFRNTHSGRIHGECGGMVFILEDGAKGLVTPPFWRAYGATLELRLGYWPVVLPGTLVLRGKRYSVFRQDHRIGLFDYKRQTYERLPVPCPDARAQLLTNDAIEMACADSIHRFQPATMTRQITKTPSPESGER